MINTEQIKEKMKRRREGREDWLQKGLPDPLELVQFSLPTNPEWWKSPLTHSEDAETRHNNKPNQQWIKSSLGKLERIIRGGVLESRLIN